MSEFEIVVLTLSLVLGLGVAQILSSFAAVVRDRQRTGLYWVPLAWGFLIFLFHVGFFFALLDMDAAGASWTWDRYGPVLLYVVLLFLAGALVLPPQGTDRRTDLREDFESHGRLSLLPLGLALLIASPMNVQSGGAWLSLANLANATLVALAVIALLSKRRRWQESATIAFALVQLLAMVFLWSNPGTRALFS